MCIPTIGALKWDGVAATRSGFVVSSFNTALISALVGIAGVGGGANGAGWGGFFAELSGVSKLAAIAALSNKGG
jgi:hypothetical protein